MKKHLPHSRLSSGIFDIIPIMTKMLLDDSRAVRMAVFELFILLETNAPEEAIMTNAAQELFQALHDSDPNKRLVAVETVPSLLRFITLHHRLFEMLPCIVSLLTNTDSIVSAAAVKTLAALSEIETFHATIVSQISPVINILHDTTLPVLVLYNTIQVFIECVKYPSTLHDIVMLALPHLKELLQSSSSFLQSAAKKMIDNCAVYPSFHSSIIRIIQTMLSELNVPDQRLLAWLQKHSTSERLHKISQDAIPKNVATIKNRLYDVRNWSLLALNGLSSFSLEASFPLALPKLIENLSQYSPTTLLEVLNPDENKHKSLRGLIGKHLKDDSSFISVVFLSLVNHLALSKECPNIPGVELVSRYDYLQTPLQEAIPQFVRRALEGDKCFLILVVELLKNENLHESFSSPAVSALILQTLSSSDTPLAEQTQAMKHHDMFVSESGIFKLHRLRPSFRYPRLSTTLEYVILSHEAEEYEYAEAMYTNGNDKSLLMRQHITIQQEMDLDVDSKGQESEIKPAFGTKLIQKRSQQMPYKLFWKCLADASDLSATESALLLSRAEFEPPAIRILLEFLKHPLLYIALENCHVFNPVKESRFTSFLKAELKGSRSDVNATLRSVIWIYAIRDLAPLPHLHQDLIEILPTLCEGFLSDTVPGSYKLASVITLGGIIQSESLLSELERQPNGIITPDIIFEVVSTALTDKNPNVRMAAVGVCEMVGRQETRDNAYSHTLLTAHNIIPSLMNMLSDARESIHIRYLVAKCLEAYSRHYTLRTPLTQTIPGLLNLLLSPITQTPNATIVPGVVCILISYGQYEDLWSIIRDILSYKYNIPQKEYTTYEPPSALCDGEFQKYTFLKQPFLDVIPLLLDILELDAFPTTNSQLVEKANYEEDEEDAEETKIIDLEQGVEQNELENMTDLTLAKSINPTPIQLCALNCVIELMRFPSLFIVSPSASSTHNALLTKYTNILAGETRWVVITDEEKRAPDDEGSSKAVRKKHSRTDTDSCGPNSILSDQSADATKNHQPVQEPEPSTYKQTTKARQVLLATNPILQYKAVCGLEMHAANSALYPHILTALGRIVDSLDVAISADSANDSWIEDRHELVQERRRDDAQGHKKSKARHIHRMIDALSSLIVKSNGVKNTDFGSALSFKEILTSSLLDMLFETKNNNATAGDVASDVLETGPSLSRYYIVRSDVEPFKKIALLQILWVLSRCSIT